MFETIQVAERADGIGIITLNRPEKKNAISIRMRREIIECLGQWQESTAVNAVVFIGAGEVFSAGFDLGEFGKESLFDELFDSSAKYHRQVWNFLKPTIAAINGAALAGGFDLATLCDVRICSESAFFGHPEIKFGAPPIYTPLRWIVGEGLARDLCLTGRRISAIEAHRIGLVSQVVAANELFERAIQIALTILEMPLETLKFTKAYLTGNAGKGFEESFRIEHDDAFQRFLLRAPKKE